MKLFLNKLWKYVHIISIIILFLFAPLFIYDGIAGAGAAERFVEKINFPLNYDQLLTIGLICTSIVVVHFFIELVRSEKEKEKKEKKGQGKGNE